MEEVGEGRFVTFSDSKCVLEGFAAGPGHRSESLGTEDAPTAPQPCSGLCEHVGRASLVPKSPASKPHAHHILSALVLLLFQFNSVLVSLGSWPGDMEGTKLPANKWKFCRTVLVGL